MSLLESSQHAPLASTEKSLDKLEIELEEKQELNKESSGIAANGVEDNENGTSSTSSNILKQQQELQNGSKGDIEEDKAEEVKEKNAGERKTKFSIKLPKILRKSFNEKSTQNKEIGGIKTESKDADGNDDGNDDNEDLTAKEKLLPETESSLVVDSVVASSSSVTNEQDSTAVAAQHEESKPTTSDSLLDSSNAAVPNTSSFITTFSTPKWINFRRVFSFNSAPGSLMMRNKTGKTENIQPVSLILDIPEEGVYKEEPLQKDETAKDNGSKISQPECQPLETLIVEKPEDNTVPTSNGHTERNFITPILQLFQRRGRILRSTQEKDVEAAGGGEIGTELVETATATNNKPFSDENGTKLSPGEEMHENGQTEQTDGESLPKHENKLLDEFGLIETKNGKTEDNKKNSGWNKDETINGKGSGHVKASSELWRQRIQERWPKHNKPIIAAILILIILVIIIVTIAVFRVNKVIDISTFIIGGKYIETITSCGKIQGISEDGGFVFRGIPYALPPVGVLRWKPAQTHQNLHHCWNGTYLAHNHSTPCWQFYRDGTYDGAEDCLYLDLYTPKVYYDTPIPVVVFIGGDSLNGGQSSTLVPSAALAREKNVVFITVTIRRSVLGFLSLDHLTTNSYPMTSGNYGLSDLLAALTWVKYNVEHFGGDKDHVTLLGHNSGATLAMALMSSPLGKGLFHQVWVSGGSPLTGVISFQDAEVQNAKFLEEMYLNCSDIVCMQNRGPEQLLQNVPYDWRAFHQDLPTKNEVKHHWLVRDGLILREPLHKNSLFPSGPEYPTEKIPFVSGTSADVDASPEMFSFLPWNDSNKFSTYLESKLGDFGTSLSREVIDRYIRPESTPWQQFVSLLSDVRTICPLYYTTLAMADEFVKNPVYFYVATQRKYTPIGYVAEANIDIAAIFGVYEAETREEKKFVQNMEKLFYEFVKKGKFPDEQGILKSIYIVDENIQKIYAYPNCEFWQQHNFYPNYSRVD